MGNYNSFLPNYQQPMQPSGPNWVPGIDVVKMSSVANGNVGVFFDSNEQLFYFKEVDLSGMPRIRTFKYEEVHDKSNPEYVTKEDFDKAIGEIKDLLADEKGDK